MDEIAQMLTNGTLLGNIVNYGNKLLGEGDDQPSVPAPFPLYTRSKVQLAISPLGPKLPKFQAYHTSVLVDGDEYSFSGQGITCAKGLWSHTPIARAGGKTTRIDFGVRNVNAEAFNKALRPYFIRGSYDLLKKNCNSFSDCALFYLTGNRVDKKYRFLESIGRTADKYTNFVQGISGGGYKPNPLAATFNPDTVVCSLHWQKEQAEGGIGASFRALLSRPPAIMG